MNKKILEMIKKTIEIIGAPISAIALIWGKDISFYVSATTTFLLSLITYIEVFVKEK